jgi:O-Antigen ligase
VYGPTTPRTDFGPRQLAPALLASLTVAALAADSGGYDPPTWSWTSVVLLLVAGVVLALGARRLAPLEWALPAFLAALGVWTFFSLVWSADVSESVHEGERTFLYIVGVATLLLLGRRSRVEGLVGALAVAITSVCCYSLATRLFTPGRGTYQVVSVDPDAAFRLSRPLGYANALALFAVLGILLSLGFALRGRTMMPRALGSAALVVLFPTLYFTYGRGAWLALAAGLGALLAVERTRLRVLARLLALAGAPAVAVSIASQTHGLTRDPGSVAAATRDGHRLAVAMALLVVLAALVPMGLERAERRLSLNAPLRRTLVAVLALIVAAALALALVRVGGPAGAVRRAYHAFNAPAPLVQTDTSRRLFSLSGNSRSEYWRVGWLEVKGHPWLGGGAGSYQRFWLRDRRAALPVRDAHSLYLETLAELGPIGLLLLLCALGTPFAAVGAARAQPLVPAALGAYVAFVLHAGIDWDWEMPAVTLAALFCGTALLLAARGGETPPLRRPWRALGVTVAASLCVLSLLGFAGNRAAAAGSDALDRSDLHTAEVEARRGRRWEPWSGEPWRILGEAQLEAGEVARARASFLRGLDKDRGDWELWLDLALASQGAEREEALAHVSRLNPLSQELREVQGSP